MVPLFVLGAGFSKAISDQMPVVSELLEPLAQHLDQAPVIGHGDALREIQDLEAVLSSWYEPQPWLMEHEVLRNRSAFSLSAHWLAEELFSRQQWILGGGVAPEWLAGLVGRWHENRSTVVTLNYDTLVESTIGTLFDQSSSVPQSVYGEFVPKLGTRLGFAVFAGEIAKTLWLLKLHGSLTWWHDPQGGAGAPLYDADCVDHWNRSEPTRLEDVRKHARGLEPLIVPPVTSKSSSLGNTWLRTQWLEARRALEAADLVFLLGYSMPPADLSMRMLLGGGSSSKTFVPVNVDDTVVARLEMLFPKATVAHRWVTPTDPIPSLARAFTEDIDAVVRDLRE
jgi:hypothetical protein